MTAKFYFSLRSPYSWMGYLDLGRLYPDVAASVQWLPFWEPDDDLRTRLTESGHTFPYVEMSRAKSLYILQDVRRLTRERGLEMTWPVDRAPRWEVAHLGYLVAERKGLGHAYVDAVYRVRWQAGRDISDPEVIAAVGAQIGVDPGSLRRAADDPELREEGLEALRSVVRDGVFGVPFFICDREKFWGLDRLAGFAAMVRDKSSSPIDRLAGCAAMVHDKSSSPIDRLAGCAAMVHDKSSSPIDRLAGCAAMVHDKSSSQAALVPSPVLQTLSAADQGHAGGCG